jgi:hypothetical protein
VVPAPDRPRTHVRIHPLGSFLSVGERDLTQLRI